MKNYYKILGVNKYSTTQNIKSAFRKLVKIYHPDVNSSEDAKKKFLDIYEAYEILSDKDKKNAYDSILEDIIRKKYSKEKEETENYKSYRSWEKYAKDKAKKASQKPLKEILENVKVVAENLFTHYMMFGLFIFAPLAAVGIIALPFVIGFIYFVYYEEYKNSGKDLLSYIKDTITTKI